MEQVTQKELDTRLRDLNIEECELLRAADENMINLDNQIHDIKTAIGELHSSLNSLTAKAKNLRLERKNIHALYKHKRRELIDSCSVVPGANSVVRAPLTNAQLYMVRQLFWEALHQCLVEKGVQSADAASVQFTVSEEGSLSFYVIIP